MSLPKYVPYHLQRTEGDRKLPQSTISILVVGEQAGVWTQRLHELGFHAAFASTPHNIRASAPPDVAVFLPQDQEKRTRAATTLRRLYPEMKIVMLYEGAIRGTEIANAVIHANCSPDDLVRTLTYLVGKVDEAK